MKLIIIVTGLVLLAPDPSNHRLHLLFPNGVPTHFPEINYPSSGTRHIERLDRKLFDLSSLASWSTSGIIPSTIMDLDTLFERDIPRDWVTSDSVTDIRGRVSLPWPEQIGSGWPVRWRLEARAATSSFLTNSITLEYSSSTPAAAQWVLKDYAGHGSNAIPRMESGDVGTDTIWITNVPAGHDPPLRRDEEALHFQAYVDALRGPTEWVSTRPRLFLDETPPTTFNAPQFTNGAMFHFASYTGTLRPSTNRISGPRLFPERDSLPPVSDLGSAPANCMIVEGPIRP